MQVAICVSRYRLVAIDERESRGRFSAGGEFYALVAVFGLESDPLYVMDVLHGMSRGADFDCHERAFYGDYGDVFFDRGVGGAGDEFLHRFAAAHYGDSARVAVGDDVAAALAAIEFH